MQTGTSQFLPPFSLPFSLAKLSFLFNPLTLFVLLAVFFVLYFIGSATLWYHWSKYGMGRSEIAIVKTLFVFVSAALFLTAMLGIFYL
jgi:hypothetical protein